MLANEQAPDTPVTCKVAVNFSYVTPRWQINKVYLEQNPSLHQGAIITVTPPVKDVLPSKYTPVTVEYGQPLYDWNTYYGYVNHIEHLSGNKVELWTIGATYPMSDAKLKVWENVTASNIATQIAVKHGMHIDVDHHGEKQKLVQTGQTDFQFLADLAKRIGFKFFITGTTINFINPLLPLREATNTVPWFYVTSDIFQPKIGELIPGESNLTDTIQYSLDAETGRIIGARNQYEKFLAFGESKTFSPLVKTYSTDYSGNSVKEILSKLNGEVSDTIHWVTATANLRNGSARLAPCSVIGIRGGIADKFQGLWLVDSIVQTLTPGNTTWNYSADVSLMRDQIYSTSILPRSGWSKSAGVINTRWVNGRWISEQIGA